MKLFSLFFGFVSLYVGLFASKKNCIFRVYAVSSVSMRHPEQEEDDFEHDETLNEEDLIEQSVNASTATLRQDDPCHHCSQMHRGILHRVTDPENLSKGCLVYASLHCNTFELIRGKTVVNTFDVNSITTPILLTPGSHLCFLVKGGGSTTPEILCSENHNCRNEWWKALTRAILCSHHNTTMRHEIAGDPIIEEEEEMVQEKVTDDPDKGGINIKFSGISDMPVIKLKKSASSLLS